MPLARLPVPACAGHADRRSADRADRADRESRDVSIAIAIPIAIAIDCGVEPVAGTWIDRMNADDG